MMNSIVTKPLAEFLLQADIGTWMCDFQFYHINYTSRDIACTINAGINRNGKTFIIEIEE